MKTTPEIRISALESEMRYWKLRYELAKKYTKLVYLSKDRKTLRVVPVPQLNLPENFDADEVVESGWFDVFIRSAILKTIHQEGRDV
jgi:hypothetical protein